MCEINQTQVTHIHLLGFQSLYKFKALIFIMLLLIYIMIVSSNLIIILLVTFSDHLKIPMFFFLKHLATTDILMSTSVMPMMLNIILIEVGTLSFVECITQLYFSSIFLSVECFLIAVMSFDRFLAICTPLHYASFMSPDVCLRLVFGSWFLVALLMSGELIAMRQYNFCGPNNIDYFFCDYGPVVELATSDASILLLQDFIISMFLLPVPFAFIVITYVCISYTILKISSAHGRRKAFSTCSSHLASVCIYYGSLMTVCIPTDYSADNTIKYRSFLFIVVTPLMNPIIYSIKNHKVQRAFLKLLSNGKTNKISTKIMRCRTF